MVAVAAGIGWIESQSNGWVIALALYVGLPALCVSVTITVLALWIGLASNVRSGFVIGTGAALLGLAAAPIALVVLFGLH
ncbi:hypothetical protein D5S17_12845 [Pseudonocardiaceae bacterium YIM PH 21723]|nr:hypothetical protein D5S17_12845 [Pseudonocardiaceae bacterium YIM PH 21723]